MARPAGYWRDIFEAQRFWTRQAPGKETGRIQLEAMNFFSNTQEIAWRFSEYIDDLHDVFRCNDVDFGAPEDFFAFARTLRYHSELRGDVLRVVKSVMESGTNVSFRTILTVIAVASGGPEIATCEREMSVPVKSLIESLIGVGAWSQPNADQPGLYSDLTVKGTEPAPGLESMESGGEEAIEVPERDLEENAAVPILAADESSDGAGEAVEYAEVSTHAGVEEGSFAKCADDSPADSAVDSSVPSSICEDLPSSLKGDGGEPSEHQSLSNDFSGSNTVAESKLAESTVAESLTRLELSSLQLKIYLDSIDQRISRMEPRLEKVAPLVHSNSQAHAREEPVVARFSAAMAAGPSGLSRHSNVSENAAAPSGGDSRAQGNDANVSTQHDEAATASSVATGSLPALAPATTDSRRFKVQHVRSTRRQIALPIYIGVAMLLLAALFWRFGRDTRPGVKLPVNASLEEGGNAAGASAPPPAVPSMNGPRVATAGATSVASGGAASAPDRVAKQDGAALSDAGKVESRAAAEKSAPLAKRSAQIPMRVPLRPSSSVASPLIAKGSAEVTDPSGDSSGDSSDAAEDVSSVPMSNRPVDVSPAVMAANLLSAPKPSYPRLATLMRTQGSVVMQAVISKEGTVEELHVIKGHRLLRGAAKNAVRNWRYRPYTVDGMPVEVATTVSVDFSLHH